MYIFWFLSTLAWILLIVASMTDNGKLAVAGVIAAGILMAIYIVSAII